MSYAPIYEKTWQETEREIFTPAEREECRMQAEIMKELVKRRRELGISQRKLGEMTGVTRSAIARLETGQTSPTLETMMKILVPLGKTLIMADFSPEQMPAKKPGAAQDPFYSEENQKILAESIAQLKARKGTPYELIEA